MQTEIVRNAYRQAAGRRAEGLEYPVAPETLAETGLSSTFVSDLVLKVLYVDGARSGDYLAGRIKLPFSILDEQLLPLQKRSLLEVRGVEGHGRRSYVFDLTGEGRARARELREANGYVGPAPVTREAYRWWVAVQSVRNDPIPRDRIHAGLSHLVLDEKFIDRLGPGINSGKSIFLYGQPGNGKTEIAFAMSQIMGGAIYVPHAVEMDGEVIQIYDPDVHHPAESEREGLSPVLRSALLRDVSLHDPRFERVRRPAVVVGGELTLDALELHQTNEAGVYTAPPQMKANGGVFVIDDFGRQRVRPRDLLNRWMIPLDRGTDYLGLASGFKLEVPFDCLVFFATNLNPADLAEEAFLRRIRYKLLMPNPSRQQFGEIFRRMCARREIKFEESAVNLVFDEFYLRRGIEPRSCHPGDLIADVCDQAKYRSLPPILTEEAMMDACLAYFINTPQLRAEANGSGNGNGRNSLHDNGEREGDHG
jgi:DNA-binding MarR family transcriptional regulator